MPTGISSNGSAKALRFSYRLEAWAAALLFNVFSFLSLDSAVPFSAFPDMPGATSAAPFLSFQRPRSPTSSPACGTISAVSRPNTRTYRKSRSSSRASASRRTASSMWLAQFTDRGLARGPEDE
jgi:hypothetical protein